MFNYRILAKSVRSYCNLQISYYPEKYNTFFNLLKLSIGRSTGEEDLE